MTPTTPSETSGEGKDVVRDAIRGVEHATAEVGAKIQHAGEDFVKMVDDAVHRGRDETTAAFADPEHSYVISPSSPVASEPNHAGT